MTATPEMLEKIRKLLAKAENEATTEAEAASFAAKADQLMRAHGIAEAAIRIANDEPEPDPFEDIPYGPGETFLKGRRLASWKVRLFYDVIKLYGCAGYHALGRGLRIIGRREDVETAATMFAFMHAQIDALAARHAGKGRAWLASYRYGAAQTIGERLRTARDEERAAVAGTALVALDGALALINARQRAADTIMRQNVRLTAARGPSLGSASGYHAGRREGQHAALRPHERLT